MNVFARKAVLSCVVLGTGALFVALNVTFPRDSLSLFGEIAGKLWHLALFILFWGAVFALGRGVARLWGRRRPEDPPEIAWALGIAAAVWLAFVVCAVGAAYDWVAKALVVGGAGAGAILGRRYLAGAPARVKRWLAEIEPSTAALVVAIAVLALPVALTAAEPPYSWDALTYHLAVPQFYAEAHRFIYLPDNVYASMPMGGSLFYLWPYLWDGLITANASHLVATALALALTYRLARLWLDRFYATLSAAFVVLTPVVFAAMGGAYVDHFSILFTVAALYSYFKTEGKPEERGLGSAVVVGIFLGAALGVKYTALAAGAAFVPIWVFDMARGRRRPREIGVIVGVAALLVVPWVVKAWLERGNPVFPMLYDVFGGRGFTAEQAERLLAWQAGMGRGRGILDFLLLPYRISVEAGFSYADFHGVYLPFLLPLAAAGTAFFRRAGRLLAFGWVYLLAWAFGPQQLRFLDGALPAFAVGAAGILSIAEARRYPVIRRGGRAFLVAAVAAVGFSFNVNYIYDALPGHPYLSGMKAEIFLTRRCPFYRAQKFINEELPGDAKILMVFSNQILYMERPAIYDSFLEASAFLLAAEKAESGEELFELARSWGVTHVYVYHFYESRFWPSYRPAAREKFYDFLNRWCLVVYGDESGRVYEL